MAETDENLRREVRIKPGPDPKRVRMEWLLHGEKGTVQFVAWITGKSDPSFPSLPKYEFYPLDLGYHAHVEQYEGQCRMDECEFMPDGKGCFYDGTSLGAGDLWAEVSERGDAVLWERLEEWYRDMEAATDATQRASSPPSKGGS